MDVKVHRDNSKFEVKSLFLESREWDLEETLVDFKTGLDRFAEFHNCDYITIGEVAPRKMTQKIRNHCK
jgi:uncharacterized protein YcaQ